MQNRENDKQNITQNNKSSKIMLENKYIQTINSPLKIISMETIIQTWIKHKLSPTLIKAYYHLQECHNYV